MLVVALLLFSAAGVRAQYQPIWRIQLYKLDYEILPGEHIYRGTAELHLKNISGGTQTAIFLALYRLQDVEGVEDEAGHPVRFSTNVVKAPDPDWLGYQAVAIEAKLPKGIEPGGEVTLRIRHAGPMLGYQELFPYTKDSISEDFSLLRPDVLAYPQLGPVTGRDLTGNALAQVAVGWTFHLAVTVPKPLVVAASGRQVKRTDVDTKRWRYDFESTVPTWRIDIAVANYQVLEQPDRGLKVYVFPADRATANTAMDVMAKAIESFTQWFGPLPGAGYTLIEIPEGYGSQAATRYFLQTADAFKSQEALRMLAHEISHAWNVPSREEHNSRFLDEAFATYFQALADDVLSGPGSKQHRLEEYRTAFCKRLEKHPEWGKVAIADYGVKDLTDLSYLKGPWALAILDELVGHEVFERIVRTFLTRYRESGATPNEFKAVAEEVSGQKLERFWAEWFEQGEISTSIMQQHTSAAEVAARYR